MSSQKNTTKYQNLLLANSKACMALTPFCRSPALRQHPAANAVQTSGGSSRKSPAALQGHNHVPILKLAPAAWPGRSRNMRFRVRPKGQRAERCSSPLLPVPAHCSQSHLPKRPTHSGQPSPPCCRGKVPLLTPKTSQRSASCSYSLSTGCLCTLHDYTLSHCTPKHNGNI